MHASEAYISTFKRIYSFEIILCSTYLVWSDICFGIPEFLNPHPSEMFLIKINFRISLKLLPNH